MYLPLTIYCVSQDSLPPTFLNDFSKPLQHFLPFLGILTLSLINSNSKFMLISVAKYLFSRVPSLPQLQWILSPLHFSHSPWTYFITCRSPTFNSWVEHNLLLQSLHCYLNLPVHHQHLSKISYPSARRARELCSLNGSEYCISVYFHKL